MKSLMFFYLILRLNEVNAAENTVDVVFLTHAGPRVLKTWSTDEINKISKKLSRDQFTQKFIFEESTRALVLNDLASIDLVTITTDTKTIRVPRFLIWRGFFQFNFNSKSGDLTSKLKTIEKDRIIIPAWYFETEHIRKIELSNHLLTYPQPKLKLRTNPAASRGEKIFTQNCLACHSVTTYGSPALIPSSLSRERILSFSVIHKRWPELKLNSKSERGLIAYTEALALEKEKK